MMRSIWMVLVLCVSLFAQDKPYQFDTFYDFLNLPQESADTSPPDSLDTAIQLAFAAPDSITISWNPSEIDSSDWKELRFALDLRDVQSFTPTSLTIPKATALADSDTTIIITDLYYNTGATLDTTEQCSVAVSVYDSSDNYVTMATVTKDMAINYDLPLPIDSLWISNNYDSLYFRFTPTARTWNTWSDPATTRIYYSFDVVDACRDGRNFYVTLDSLQIDSVYGFAISDFEYCTPGIGDTIRFFDWAILYGTSLYWDGTKNGHSSESNYTDYYVIYGDTTPPVAGSYSTDYVSIDSLRISSVLWGGSDDIAGWGLYTKRTAGDGLTLIGSGTDTTWNDSTFSLAGLFQDGDDTVFVEFRIRDEVPNYTTVYDTSIYGGSAAPDSALLIVTEPDTARGVVQYITVGFAPDSNAANITDSSHVIAISNIDTSTYAADTLAIKIPAQDTTYADSFVVFIKPMIASTWGTWGTGQWYGKGGGSPPAGAGTVTYEGVGTVAHVEANTSITVTPPAGDSGDLLVAIVMDDLDQSVTGWDGFTLATDGTDDAEVTASSSRQSIGYLIDAGASDYTFTVSGSTELTAVILRFSKDSGTWTIEDVATDGQAAASSPITVPSITASQDNSMRIATWGNDDTIAGGWTAGPSGMDNRADYRVNDPELGVWTEAVSTGTYSGDTISFSGGDVTVISIIIEAQ